MHAVLICHCLTLANSWLIVETCKLACLATALPSGKKCMHGKKPTSRWGAWAKQNPMSLVLKIAADILHVIDGDLASEIFMGIFIFKLKLTVKYRNIIDCLSDVAHYVGCKLLQVAV